MPDQRSATKHQVKRGGMQCSFCTESIQKAILRLEGVEKATVSLAHEEALIQYDPSKLEPWQIEEVLRSIGYTVRDPNKLRSFEEEDAEVRRERNKLVGSAALTFAGLALMSSMWRARSLAQKTTLVRIQLSKKGENPRHNLGAVSLPSIFL